MLHHTASTAPELNQTRYLAIHTAQVSCHYVVGRDGYIWKIAEDEQCTRHAGTGEYKNIKNSMNMHSIGIEVCSDGHNFTITQLNATMDLIRDLMGKYGILKENVIRHKDYTMRKWDIGDNFRYPQYATYAKFQDDLIKKTVEEKKEDKEIQDLVSRGIMNGERLDETATRREISYMIHRTIKKIHNEMNQ